MAITGPSVTDQNIFVALRAFLTSVLPAGVEVIEGQINRVSSPLDNFVVMIPIFREALATNLQTYDFPDATPNGTTSYLLSTKVTIQLDIHGPAGGDNVQLISTLFPSDYGVEIMQLQGYEIAPLYISEPRQVPFSTAEQQYDDRWTIDAVLQANPVVTRPMQFADELAVGAVNPGDPPPPTPAGITTGLINVDVAYPPTPGSVAIVSCGMTVSGRSF